MYDEKGISESLKNHNEQDDLERGNFYV